MSKRLLSVIIPAFNSESTIVRSIRSCSELNDVEVVVVDDGSTDKTGLMAQRAGARVIYQTNSGAASARRNGLKETQSEYVVFLDADDELVSDGVIESLNLLISNSRCVVAGGRVLGIWPNGRSRVLGRKYDYVTTDSLVEIGFGPWPPAASVIRRSALISATQLEVATLSPRFAEDYELIIRLSLVGDIIAHDTISTKYKLYAGKSSDAPLRAIRDKEYIRAHYAGALGIYCHLLTESEIKSAARMRASRVAFNNGRYMNGFSEALGSLVVSPTSNIKKIVSALPFNNGLK